MTNQCRSCLLWELFITSASNSCTCWSTALITLCTSCTCLPLILLGNVVQQACVDTATRIEIMSTRLTVAMVTTLNRSLPEWPSLLITFNYTRVSSLRVCKRLNSSSINVTYTWKASVYFYCIKSDFKCRFIWSPISRCRLTNDNNAFSIYEGSICSPN